MVEAPPAAAAPAARPPAPEVVTLDGYVRRSSGHSTTWVNGVPQNDRLQVDRDGVRIEDEQRHAIHLRVGESYDVNSGVRQKVLGEGNAEVQR